MLAKFSQVESKRTVSKFRRGKRQLLFCVHLLHEASVWNLGSFMLQGCNIGKEMYKRTWCTGKFIVLSIKTFYFFAVLLLSPLSLVVWSSSISATMGTWHHTSLYCLVSLLLQKQFACKFGAKLLPKNPKCLFLSSSCNRSLKNSFAEAP